MPTYRAKRKVWLSHECRLVEEGQTFTTTFPKGMKLGETLELVSSGAEDSKRRDGKGQDDGNSLAG